ncbi:MAG: MOSC N-terminal beta barrel domain-containing protein [Ilumatobacteraceae bacterium]
MRVLSVWRYPVKSMQGEPLDTAPIDDLGIVGDRQWALVDTATGLALTARRVPELLFAQARWLGADAVEIELPDGTVTTDDGELSAWLDRPVTLTRAGGDRTGRYEIAADFEDEAGSEWIQWDGPQGTFHDSGQARVSVLATGSIGDWDRRRFRGNLVVGADGVGAENELVGQHLSIGSVELDVIKPIDRCVMTTRPQPGGIERDLDVLRTINAERQTWLGVGALVAQAGTLAVGDEVRVG